MRPICCAANGDRAGAGPPSGLLPPPPPSRRSDAGHAPRTGGILAAHGYRIAPVTLDNSTGCSPLSMPRRCAPTRRWLPASRWRILAYMESIFAFFEARSLKRWDGKFPQTPLIHASELNADAMPEPRPDARSVVTNSSRWRRLCRMTLTDCPTNITAPTASPGFTAGRRPRACRRRANRTNPPGSRTPTRRNNCKVLSTLWNPYPFPTTSSRRAA